MKNEPSKSPSPTSQAPARHQFEHVTPTVIHDPEADMMLLARWAHRALANPTRFWGVLGGGIAAILAIVVLSSLASSKSSSQADLWSQLDAAKNADDQVKIAKENPNSPAASWALLQAASRLYKSGVDDLPKNRDAALQSLKKAVDLFDEAGKGAAKDSPVALAAALGKARSLEARNELPKAVDQYKLVADTWPNAPEAAEAKQLAAALQKPDAAAFYKELYSFTPEKVTLPPMGTQSFDLPLPSGIGGASGSLDNILGPATGGVPSIPIPPPPPSAPKADDAKPAAPAETKPAAPAEAKPATPAETKPEPAKPAAPAATPAPAPAPTPAPAPAPAPAEARKPGN
jgi:hypothetical protein